VDAKLNEGTYGFMNEIEEELNQALGSLKGTMILKGILDRHGCQEIYVPKTTELYKQLRDKQIRLTFNGCNHAELAEQWDISERTIRNIIDSHARKSI